ncbi:hypothetical protein [Limnoglobus roseus]|uniref:WD40 repeat domain-containing protein n=1 Tax=Limnoglobus roseus TaxID=2598579 RepID=A0A5C1AFC7_9BACT|nr:hypothetical protein [Limnoglobus roseus]QEL16432.1 hypothetical protein PX52LOC_03386 [Limnoglobus roseus]
MLILKTRSQKLSRVSFDPSGRGLAAGGQRGVYWWQSVFDGSKPVCLDEGECSGLGFTTKGEYLFAVVGKNRLAVFNLSDRRPSYVGLKVSASTVAVCPATGLAVTESWSGGEMVGWRVTDDGGLKRVWATTVAPGSIGSTVAFAGDGSWFVRAAQDPRRVEVLPTRDPRPRNGESDSRVSGRRVGEQWAGGVPG